MDHIISGPGTAVSTLDHLDTTPRTSRNIINVNDVYETLVFQIYLCQNDGLFYVCGDLNSKIGD